MKTLSEVFSDPNSRVTRTVMAVDINESTKMKEQETEATWLTTYGQFFSYIATIVSAQGGQVVKYMGDGALAVFKDDAENAINAAIQIQEAIALDNENARIKLNCSIGIASGEVIEFDVQGQADYIGSTVDRAFRLCSAANAKAIFIDLPTASDARMSKVCSKVGLAHSPRWKAPDYQGDDYTVVLKGFSKPVSYHEIKWSGEKYGVSSGYLTSQASEKRTLRPDRPSAGPRKLAIDSEWIPGQVVSWREGKGGQFGFIRSEARDGGEIEDFYFNPSYLFTGNTEIEEGADVLFLAADALPNASNRRATSILLLNELVQGVINRIVSGKGFGFADIEGQGGARHNLFIFPVDESELAAGDRVEASIFENDKGPIGRDIRRI